MKNIIFFLCQKKIKLFIKMQRKSNNKISPKSSTQNKKDIHICWKIFQTFFLHVYKQKAFYVLWPLRLAGDQ